MVAMQQRASQGQGREAITLVELLVVIAILGILAALTAGAVMLYMGTQRLNNTKAFLGKINTRLNNQYQAVIARAMNKNTPVPAAIVSMAGSDGNASARARVIYAKALLKQTFPMSFSEALNPAPLQPLAAYQTYLGQRGITGSSPATQNFESSACLLMALQRSDSGGGTTAQDIGAGGASTDFAAGSGTIKALTDGWGHPLQFCRWPSGSPQLNPIGPQTGANDPLDPQLLLNYGPWQQSANGQMFQTTFHLLGTGNLSYRLAPLVASAGPDGIMALDPNTMASQGPNSNDDLYSVTGP